MSEFSSGILDSISFTVVHGMAVPLTVPTPLLYRFGVAKGFAFATASFFSYSLSSEMYSAKPSQ